MITYLLFIEKLILILHKNIKYIIILLCLYQQKASGFVLSAVLMQFGRMVSQH
jgi:hypothetical protein